MFDLFEGEEDIEIDECRKPLTLREKILTYRGLLDVGYLKAPCIDTPP